MIREEGYYWVKMPDDDINPGWKIALWHDNNGGDDADWCWHSSAFDTKHYDNFFEEINENRIRRNEGEVLRDIYKVTHRYPIEPNELTLVYIDKVIKSLYEDGKAVEESGNNRCG